MKQVRTRKFLSVGTVLWIVLGFVALVSVVFGLIRKPPEDVMAREEEPVLVRTMAIEPRDVPDVLVLPGRIKPCVDTDLAVEKAGVVVAIAVDEGDKVAAGQVLLRVDSRQWEHARRQAEIENREAREDLARWQEVKKTGAVSESDFASVRERSELAEAALSRAELDVSQCVVRSPVSGIVDNRYIDIGEYASEGTPVLRVVRIERVKLAVDIPERDISAVGSGKTLPFTVTACGECVLTGVVSFVSVSADPRNNSFRVEADVENTQRLLRAGMIADVTIERGVRKNAVVVPLTAVIPQKGEHVAYVVRDGRAERRVVRLDAIVGREAVIAAGLSRREMLVVEGHRSLRDGMAVNEANVTTGDGSGGS